MNAVNLWVCATCQQQLPAPWSRCDRPGLHGDRYLVTPYGQIPAGPADSTPREQVAA